MNSTDSRVPRITGSPFVKMRGTIRRKCFRRDRPWPNSDASRCGAWVLPEIENGFTGGGALSAGPIFEFGCANPRAQSPDGIRDSMAPHVSRTTVAVREILMFRIRGVR